MINNGWLSKCEIGIFVGKYLKEGNAVKVALYFITSLDFQPVDIYIYNGLLK